MLTSDQCAIIKATVPLLETGGEALTTHFYKILLEENPELGGVFNTQHQRSGTQARALANGVLMYARHIDQLEALGPLVTQIVNKHVSLQVKPEHYPIVGTYLLRSIREVLGDEVATPAVIDAWGTAYGQLADILIGAEELAYAETAAAEGGWRGPRSFRVSRIETESTEISSFYLAPTDGAALLAHVPGQYIAIDLQIDGRSIRRNYSLSGAPNKSEYRISVKREPDGFASAFMHSDVTVGNIFQVYAPSGEMKLIGGSKPLVLISGGVGLTPMVAMLDATRDSGREIHFIHAARNPSVHAFRDQVLALAKASPSIQVRYCYEEVGIQVGTADVSVTQGRIGLQHLKQWIPQHRDVEAYVVGPKAFMGSVVTNLHELGVPPAQIHYEFFGPTETLS